MMRPSNAADWEKTKRVIARFASESIDEYVNEFPKLFQEKASVEETTNTISELARFSNQVLLLRDVLWLGYDMELTDLLKEMGTKTGELTEKTRSYLERNDLGHDKSNEHFESAIKNVIGTPNSSALSDLLDDAYYHPAVAERFKSTIKSDGKNPELKLMLDYIDKIAEADDKVEKNGEKVQNNARGWLSLKKARGLITQKALYEGKNIVLGSSFVIKFAKGLHSAFNELKKEGHKGYLTFGAILNGIDPYEEMVRACGGADATEILDKYRKEINIKQQKISAFEEIVSLAMNTAVYKADKNEGKVKSSLEELSRLSKKYHESQEGMLASAAKSYVGLFMIWEKLETDLEQEIGARKSAETKAHDLENELDEKTQEHDNYVRRTDQRIKGLTSEGKRLTSKLNSTKQSLDEKTQEHNKYVTKTRKYREYVMRLERWNSRGCDQIDNDNNYSALETFTKMKENIEKSDLLNIREIQVYLAKAIGNIGLAEYNIGVSQYDKEYIKNAIKNLKNANSIDPRKEYSNRLTKIFK